MAKIAPHADTHIHLSLSSVTGLRYKTVHCVECGQPIIERNNDQMMRIGNNNYPSVARVSADGSIPCVCVKCSQKYSIVVTLDTQISSNVGVPLYMQPQSIFMAITPMKMLRDIYCMECGKAFYSVSDRMNMLSDNTMPINMIDQEKYGPMEVWCKFHHCKQRWSVFV